MQNKYKPTVLPLRDDAVAMAIEREEWARMAMEKDQPGSAREFELTALLLRWFANSGDRRHAD
jgi:hypothetical protein